MRLTINRTFFSSSMRDVDDNTMGQDLPVEGDDILYIFQSGQIIRVQCEEIELVAS